MTRIDGTCSALDHYDHRRDPADHAVEKTLPEDPAPVHAILRPTAGHDPIYLESFQYQRAACGAFIKVLLPLPFANDDDSCPRCVAEVQSWQEAPEAWWQRRREWLERLDARRAAAEREAIRRADAQRAAYNDPEYNTGEDYSYAWPEGARERLPKFLGGTR